MATPLVPATGCLVGLYAGDAASGGLVSREKAMGRKVAINHVYGHYASPLSGTKLTQAKADITAGRTPMFGVAGGGSGSFYLDSFIAGQHDSDLAGWADAIKNLNAPVFFKPWQEMNGSWYKAWSGQPAKYVKAYQHWHDVFTQRGVTNASWVWNPNNFDVQGHYADYYPGDAYVDWVAIDGYDKKTKSFSQLFQPIYTTYQARKPVMVAETGTSRKTGDPAKWITTMQSQIKASFPQVKALVYFDADYTSQSGFNWTLDETSAKLAAWVKLGKDPYFA